MSAPHALVVGGSGMLAGVCTALAREGWAVSVLARRQPPIDAIRSDLDALPGASVGSIHAVLADYHDDGALTEALQRMLRDRGPISLAIAWIHSGAPRALAIVARTIGAMAIEHALDNVPLYQVLGSIATDPRLRPIDPDVAAAPGITLRRVALLSVREPDRRRGRWLTHAEICAGVLHAIRTGAPMTEVGGELPPLKRPRRR